MPRPATCGSPCALAAAAESTSGRPAPRRTGFPPRLRMRRRPRAAAGPKIASPPRGCPEPDRRRRPIPRATASAGHAPISARAWSPTPMGVAGPPSRSVPPPRASVDSTARSTAARGLRHASSPPPAPRRPRSTALPRRPPENRNPTATATTAMATANGQRSRPLPDFGPWPRRDMPRVPRTPPQRRPTGRSGPPTAGAWIVHKRFAWSHVPNGMMARWRSVLRRRASGRKSPRAGYGGIDWRQAVVRFPRELMKTPLNHTMSGQSRPAYILLSCLFAGSARRIWPGNPPRIHHLPNLIKPKPARKFRRRGAVSRRREPPDKAEGRRWKKASRRIHPGGWAAAYFHSAKTRR